MARPSKYNWNGIQKAYEGGATVEDICDKYRITKKTLQNKIYEKRWTITGNIDADVNEFKAILGKVTEKAQNNPETTSIYAEKIQTVIEDNELISNNRRLSKAFQGLLGKGIRENMFKTAQDIKSGVASLKDIESMANPNANQMQINNQINNENTSKEITYKVIT